MSTTYSNPKEMLGYIVVKFIDGQLPLLQQIPFDRRAVFGFYYQLKGLDAQLITFREDMQLTIFPDKPEEEDTIIPYREAMIEIQSIIKENWRNVMAKDYEEFLGALYKWSELIASCYPKLGLVPESETGIDDRRENTIVPDEKEMKSEETINEFVEPSDSELSKQEYSEPPPIQPEPRNEPNRFDSERERAEEERRKEQQRLRREAYKLV